MNWITLYITGKGQFSDDVHKKLDGSKIEFMPGYVGSSSLNGEHDMVWILENTPIREVKEAIGSKLIWKYRLRFYLNLEDFLEEAAPASGIKWTDEDQLLLDSMRRTA